MQTAVQRNRSGSLIKRHTVLLAFVFLLCTAAVFSRWSWTEAAPLQRAAGEQGALRLMTYNIRHGEGMDNQVRLSAIRAQIEQGNADFIALQEVDRYQWRTGLQDQASNLAKALHMYYKFAPAFRHGFSEYGIALLSRFPLENVRVYPLPGGSNQEPRTVLTAQIKLHEQVVTIVTTHLGVARSERELQMPALVDILKSMGTPLIVMGDFNMPDSDALMSGLHQMLYKIPLQPPQATVVKGGEIDHIFTSFAPGSSAWTHYDKSSDHIPVLGQITVIQ
ncbi:endonuclease/exonuclease/phosphatase family protein [Paenibacillus radicis (ex Xue et al. 2023)]|uniref:Endonuclease/exonuclease/phosphatase family protein n=1 Tax=Paenibacillus radicis (ex Xue et al. 2023) TaxID=2972489 RepID=A0ABT1YS00_9BACL|nr:endonuclease/exonuclease/phosphatase family protein [Paenibacillus radicis (ex Xue et al. 2023)]MCR8635951.1 endonuclease/exonuclease/phosphatase family protein [Paenibacillus radicis (ex Xue et al. 2023)]